MRLASTVAFIGDEIKGALAIVSVDGVSLDSTDAINETQEAVIYGGRNYL